jgi:hypothetical protein
MPTQAAAALGVVLAETNVVSDVVRGLLEQHDRLAKHCTIRRLGRER